MKKERSWLSEGILSALLLLSGAHARAEPASVLAKADDTVELRCSYRGGSGTSFEDETDRVTINLLEQNIKLWVSKRNDGWYFRNVVTPLGKEVTSLNLDSNGVIDGVGRNFFVSSIFRYAQKDGRFQWIWVGGSGNVYQLEFNCWRIG